MSVDDSNLRELLSDAVTAADPTLRERLLTDRDAYLELVALTAQARAETEALLRLSVAGARSAGLTWESIGHVLDMSRQAAQQRYGRAEADGPQAPGRLARLAPLTAFTEMRILERAGRYGWYLVGWGPATLIVRKSEEQWEHQRVFASRATGRALETQGWEPCGVTWFPWGYYRRALGRPAEREPDEPDYLMRG